VQSLANFSVTAEQLVKYLGENIDLFEIYSVSEADHVQLQQLIALGEQWGNARGSMFRGSGMNE